MKRISDFRGFMDTDVEHIRSLLKEWKPRSFDLTEKEQEADLFAWLKKRMPDVPMSTQYGIAKGRADIVIQDTHVIELKLGFGADKVAEFDRCLGQLERYSQKWVNTGKGRVYLVVVGVSDVEFRDMLHKWFQDRTHDELLLSETYFYLIEKNMV